VAGKMDEDDERSAMVWEFARLLGELAPKAFVMGKRKKTVSYCA
jgi:site-specific DNA-cytosine methylase